jgi:Xaa-Pro aminopeptidase
MSDATNVPRTSLSHARLGAVRRHLDAINADLARTTPVDAVLVTQAENRRYATGFTGSAGLVMISATDAAIFTDFRYVEQAGAQSPAYEIVRIEGSAWDAVATRAAVHGVRTLLVEADNLTLDAGRRLQASLEAHAPGVSVEEGTDLLVPLRQVKDATEVESMRRAVLIADRAIEAVGASLRVGMTERQIAWKLEVHMREAGATGLSFPTIVASGPNGAMPHHRPGDRPIQVGEPIVIDMGCVVDGYCSDMTRTLVVGEPDETFWNVYNTVLAAQEACEDGLRAGMTGVAADALARDTIGRAGFDPIEAFGHSTGHGVGLAIHEAPWVSRGERGKAPIPVGAVVTVEPGIYLPGWGGVRIEDMVVVGEHRCHVMTTAHKRPVVTLAG